LGKLSLTNDLPLEITIRKYQHNTMSFSASFLKRTFHFGFDARTSRGQLRERDCWFLKIKDDQQGVEGTGEAAPILGLSEETKEEVEQQLESIVAKVNTGWLEGKSFNNLADINQLCKNNFSSSVTCALETALLDLNSGGKKIIFDNSFARRESGIATNGLVWIGGMDSMLQQISIKIEEGFKTLKIKIGSLDFDKEIDILQYIRRKYFREKIVVRLDANGAFKHADALYKLHELSRWDIHSIEQPIAAGQHEAMAEICAKSPIPIALDEELIGLRDLTNKLIMLEKIKPHFLIFKPSIIGGFHSCGQWIELAESKKIGWWITSALESSIGLNAVAQFTAQYPTTIPQGLGTGQIYSDNIESPLEIIKGELKLSPKLFWEGERTEEDENDQ
jgi:o-succinylbenzoate synthase